MVRVLLIDQSLEVAEGLKSKLGSSFQWASPAQSEELGNGLLSSQYDLILSDLRWQGEDLLSHCRRLKTQTPYHRFIWMCLTAVDSLESKIQAFQSGVEDYLVHPISLRELVARIEMRLKISREAIAKDPWMSLGNLRLNIPFQRVVGIEQGEQRDLKLTPTEFRLLYCFARNEGEVITREDLLSAIWDEPGEILSRTIDKHISTLKKKLGSEAERIHSVHARGYRFHTDVPGFD